VDPAAHHDAAASYRPQGDGHQLSRGREDDRGVQLFARAIGGASRPHRSHLEREVPPLLVARTHEGEDPAPLVAGDLDDDVGGGPEAVESETLAVPRELQRAPADEPGAEQRRGLEVRVIVGDREAEALVGCRPLGEAAVDLVAGESRAGAQVLVAGTAIAALAARPPEPRHAHAAARRVAARTRPGVFDGSHDLMAEHERQLGVLQLPVDDVQVRAADATGVHAEQDLPRAGPRNGYVRRAQRRPERVQQHRAHAPLSHPSGRSRLESSLMSLSARHSSELVPEQVRRL